MWLNGAWGRGGGGLTVGMASQHQSVRMSLAGEVHSRLTEMTTAAAAAAAATASANNSSSTRRSSSGHSFGSVRFSRSLRQAVAGAEAEAKPCVVCVVVNGDWRQETRENKSKKPKQNFIKRKCCAIYSCSFLFRCLLFFFSTIYNSLQHWTVEWIN